MHLLTVFKKTIKTIYIYLFAEQIIGPYPQIKAKKNRVNLFDYHPELLSEEYNRYNNVRYNLGDSLGFVVTSYMLGKRGLSLDSWVKKRKHLYCIGSNIFSGYQHATIWGAGLISTQGKTKILYRYPFSKFDFRAVRGPLTREWVIKFGHKCPEVYGDPAILMPLIYQPKVKKKNDLLVIPQFVTETEFRNKYPNLHIVSMNTNDYKSVIDEIASAKKIVTSSLHAIILADAYGIPSVLFRGLSSKIDFKYLDYYYSTGRRNIKIAESFEEAMQMKPLALPDLKELQDGLIKSFPYDLWEQ